MKQSWICPECGKVTTFGYEGCLCGYCRSGKLHKWNPKVIERKEGAR